MGTDGRSSGAPRDAAGDARRRWSRARTALLALTVFAAIGIVGFVPYRLEVRAARHELQRKVLAVGRLKAREVEHWLEERRESISAAALGPRIALDVERVAAGAALAEERREWVRARLSRLKTLGGHAEVLILARDGRTLFAAGDPAVASAGLRRDLAARAASEELVLFSDLQKIPASGAGAIVLDAFAPLYAVDERGTRVAGTLVFRLDPRRYLFPLIQAWPTDSRTAETLLVTRDGDSVLFLNDLRFREGTALDLRLPAADPELVGAKAVRGARGVVEGLDYRDEPVLAWVEAVEGTPWTLISKIDQAEVYAPLRDFLWIWLAFLAAAALVAAAVTRVRVGAVREALLRDERAERERLIASLRKALDDVKTLRGIVPICASCKRVRDDAGFWKQVEAYVSEHTEAQFSHGVCPECLRRLYPSVADTPPPTGSER